LRHNASNHVSDALALQAESEQAQIDQHDGAGHQHDAKRVDGLGNVIEPCRIAHRRREGRLLDPCAQGKDIHA
jgi:hypothetical protein